MKKLTPKIVKQRKAIALDVIKQLEAEAYHATRGQYIGQLFEAGDLQKSIKKLVTPSNPCDVCALGSTFLSAVRVFDKFQMGRGHIVPLDDMRRKLREYFSNGELGAIESSFEGQAGFVRGAGPLDRDREYNRFSSALVYREFLKQLSEHDRLVWLMRSVISAGKRRINTQELINQMMLSFIDGKFADIRENVGL